MESELRPYDYQKEYYSNYEVWLRDRRNGNRRSIILWAENFGEAETLVTGGENTRTMYGITHDEEIIKIDKEYETDTHDPPRP